MKIILILKYLKGVEGDIIRGAYLFKKVGKSKLSVNLLGSGTIFREIIAAADLLEKDFGVSSNLISATSYNLLHRDGMNVIRNNMLNPTKVALTPFITELLEKTKAKVSVSATDYIRNYSEQIREYVPGRYIVLGTDGFGRSDLRVALREFFEVNRYYIAIAALKGLADEGLIEAKVVADAIKKYKILTNKSNPWEV